MNEVIIGAVSAWGICQLAKVVFGVLRLGRSDLDRVTWRLIWAGGMPSSHSAFVTSMALLIAKTNGLRSPLFGMAFVLAAVVVYDRAKLHHMYRKFQETFPSLKEATEADPVLVDLVGHTSAQIATGIVIGLITAAIVATLWS